MQKPSLIVVAGSIAIDRIMSFGGTYRDIIQPDKLDSLSVSMLLDDMHDARGGNGGNITYSLGLLGESSVLLSSVGKDGLLYMEKLAEHGVNITHIHESELPTATFTVITDNQQNQIGGFYPGAMRDSDSLRLDPWKNTDAIVLISAHDPDAMRRQVAECKQLGLRLCYDVGQQVSNLPGEDMVAGIEAATILIVNDYELSVLATKTGRQIEAIKAHVPIVITTLGKDGSVIEGKDVPEPINIGAVAPSKVIDPTGAGDAYRAGFLYGYARQWPLKTCGQLGATIATYSVETMGPQEHTFTPEAVATRYQQTFGESIIL